MIRKLAIALLSLSPATTMAGGLWLNEFGDPSQGRARAGAQTGTHDASTAVHNPSSMTRLDSDHLMVTGGFIYSKVEFDVQSNGLFNGDGDGGEAGDIIPVGSLYYTRRLNDDTWLGLSLAGWSGAGMDYNNDWAGRFQATRVNLVAMALMPSVGYKVNDKLSLGFGLPIMYTELEMDLAVPNGPGVADDKASLDGDDLLVAVNLSALYEFTDQTRVGIVYNSEFDADYDGGIKTTGGLNVSAETSLALAAIIRMGLSHDINDLTTIHFTLGWDDWSTMDDVTISAENQGASLPRNWNDTYHYAAGVTHQVADTWLINAGIAYDTDPVDKEDRTADLPIDRQIRYAFGAEYVPAKGPSIGASLVYADYGNAPIQSDGLGDGNLTGFSGDYKSNDIILFALSVNWKLDN
jgi:long-chain fatty acid transport protein